MSPAFLVMLAALLCGVQLANADASAVSNSDLKDRIMSLVHSYSLLDNKLERHEQRERSLGEVIKRSMASLQKGQKAFEPVRATFDRLDERVSQIESLLINKESEVAKQQTKLANTLELILKFMTDSKEDKPKQSKDSSDEEDDNDLGKKIEDLSDNIRSLRKEIGELKDDWQSAGETSKGLLQQTEKLVNSKLSSADEVISKIEDKLSHFYVTAPLATEKSNDESEWAEKISSTLEQLKKDVGQIKASPAAATASTLGEPERIFLRALANETLEAIEDMRLEVLTASDKSLTKTTLRFKEATDKLDESVNEVLKTVTEAASVSETFYKESGMSFDKLKKDVDELSNIDKVLMQTSENVLDTKRRVEYGVHQIIMEMGETVRINIKELNATFNARFDEIDETILENHNGALSNLTSKIETEISQVWRQIGIMYKEISASKASLDKLQEQTESYVNGTVSAMDSMEGKVTQITTRMHEVDSNLNFLLGRLSLVTTEFNNVKTGIGAALDNIRDSFKKVRKQVEGPGPHQIEDDDQDSNNLLLDSEKH